VALHRNQKLGLRYFGPFPIIDKIGAVAYKVLLPPTAKIHPVFHVVNLKLCKGDHNTQYFPLPFLTTDTEPVSTPEAVVGERVVLQQDQEVPQILVKWMNLPTSEATWEGMEDFKMSFPNFNLEDKINFNGGSIVMKGDKENITTTESHVQQGHLAKDPHIQELRRGLRAKMPNRKYSENYVK